MIVEITELCCVCLGAGGQDPLPDGLGPGSAAFCPQHEGHQGQCVTVVTSHCCTYTNIYK